MRIPRPSFVKASAILVMTAVLAASGVMAADRNHRSHGNGMKAQAHGTHHAYRGGTRSHRNRHIGIGGLSIYLGDTGGCGVSYRKWKATGSRYWRNRYQACRHR